MLGGFDPSATPADRRRVTLVLAVAIFGISTSAVLVRGMDDAAPLTVAAWRTLGASLLLSPGIWLGQATIKPRQLAGIVAAGVLLGLHFWLWFASIHATTILRSTLLVCTVPLWSGLMEWAISGQRPAGRFWFGATAALAGSTLTAGSESGEGQLLGDAMALGAGILWAIYLQIGRAVRQRVGIATYMGLVCFCATLFLFPAAVATSTPLLGFSTTTWGLLLCAILGPQLLGHQGFNYAVKWLPSHVIATVMLLEPLGAALLAAAAFGEFPPPTAALGGAIVLGGVVLATRAPKGA